MDLIRASFHSFEDSVDSFFVVVVSVLEGLGCFEIAYPTPTSFFFFFFWISQISKAY